MTTHKRHTLGPANLKEGELRGYPVGKRNVLVACVEGKMKALDDWGDLAERSEAAFAAGCDVLLLCHTLEALPDVVARLEDPRFEARLAEASRRLEVYRHRLLTLRQAREYIDRGRYEQALNALEQIIGLAGSTHADAAMYWKAYSLGRLGRNADALETLTGLQKRFPDSRWLNDAKALEVETRQASGQAVSPDAQSNEELKLLALRGLMRTDPDRAMPMVERLMTGTSSIRLRENALFVQL